MPLKQEVPDRPPTRPDDLVSRLQQAYEIGTAITSIHDLDTLVQLSVTRIRKDLKYQNVTLFSLIGDELVVMGMSLETGRFMNLSDLTETQNHLRSIKIGQHIIGHAALTGEPVLVSDISNDPRYKGWNQLDPLLQPMQSELAIPLKADGRVLGVLNIESTMVHDFTEDDQRILGLLTGQIAVALENIRLHQKSQEHIQSLDALNKKMASEITDRKYAEEALRNSENRLRLALEASQMGTWDYDVANDYAHRDDNYFRIFGLAHNKADGSIEEFIQRVHPDDRDRIRNHVAQIATGSDFNSEYRIIRPDGSIRWIIGRGHPYRDDDGQVIRTIGLVQDITDRKQEEEVLRENQRFIQHVADLAPLVLYVYDCPQNKFIYVNSSVTSIWGYTVEEFTHLKVLPEFVHPDDHLLISNFQSRISNTKPDEIIEGEFRIRHKDGQWRWLKTREVIFSRDEDGKPFQILGVAEDITEKRLLESQLIQAQKMEAVGNLAGGVAHDFNNLLTIINGYSEILLKDVESDYSLFQKVEAIVQAGTKAAALTSQLLAFSRKQVIQPRLLEINALIDEHIQMLGRLIGEDVELITTLDPKLHEIMFDSGQFHQIIMNLAVNARDAMPRGGQLHIETAFVYLDQTFCQQHLGIEPGHYNRLRVIDTGVGMDEETRTQIFEPFFTTKGPDKGTGLGLSTVYGIVKQNNGSIWVESEKNVGTTFTIYLQPTSDFNDEEGSEPPTPDETKIETKNILIVEDDDPVRQFMLFSLTSDGYTVFEASNGFDALVLCEQYGDLIDLVITDVVMPSMSGKELSEKIRQNQPDLIIMFVSGYIGDPLSKHQISTEMPFLEKPFTRNILSMKVRQILYNEDQ